MTLSKVVGVDFTSAPSRKKPITCMEGILEKEGPSLNPLTPNPSSSCIRIQTFHTYSSFEGFEAFLKAEDAWFGAFDFPFGQPREFIQAVGWPLPWAEYVATIDRLGKDGFEEVVLRYQAEHPVGKKQLFRLTDRLTQSSSPMKLHFTPVGKMFFQGAPRLLKAGISVLPCHPTPSGKIAVEGYPALLARKYGHKKPYKTENPNNPKAKAHAQVREKIVEGLIHSDFKAQYGFEVSFQEWRLPQKEINAQSPEAFLIQDPTGDRLDALLCCIQAAWCVLHQESGYGIPQEFYDSMDSVYDPNEGWIPSPDILSLPSKFKNANIPTSPTQSASKIRKKI
ncbi:MAG: hypothetical protein K2X66_08010 [Cyanobacteria bacterium]|nr:hypothetical protein [Cyanobacteriota bacterium]